MWLMCALRCFVCPRHWWSGISMRGVGPCVAQGLPHVPLLMARCIPILYLFDARRLGATDESQSPAFYMSDSGEEAWEAEAAGLLHQGYPENPGNWNREI
ncbi:hypothetical protein F5Y06DRAFT_291009 [Hypoxylon sp. FL0890]|nr:hypothetical protein F5Y06DRAFT_291009 [Hypoxylon sp. FL0890]